jgi:hypothetical protein
LDQHWPRVRHNLLCRECGAVGMLNVEPNWQARVVNRLINFDSRGISEPKTGDDAFNDDLRDLRTVMNEVDEVRGISCEGVVNAIAHEIATRPACHDRRKCRAAYVAFGGRTRSLLGHRCLKSRRNKQNDGNISAVSQSLGRAGLVGEANVHGPGELRLDSLWQSLRGAYRELGYRPRSSSSHPRVLACACRGRSEAAEPATKR